MLSYPYFCLCMTLCYCIKQLQLQLFTSDDQTLPSATIVLGMRKILTFLVIAYMWYPLADPKGVVGMRTPITV